MQKNRRPAPGGTTQIEDLLTPEPSKQTVKPKANKKATGKKKSVKMGQKWKKTMSKKSEKQIFKNIFRDYDRMLELAIASTGLTFGPILCGDAVESKKTDGAFIDSPKVESFSVGRYRNSIQGKVFEGGDGWRL